ncbi:MAG: hypothetical protein DRP09_15340 [Candidatus Thorarchaeota archaeon]|nr:MAG: hypothetical protein DRP09_15340 [Candidatus Thorarchaeota archaeon]
MIFHPLPNRLKSLLKSFFKFKKRIKLQKIIENFSSLFFCFRVFINLIYLLLRTCLEAVLDKYMENEAEIFIFPQITELQKETKVGQPKCPLCYGMSNLFHEDRITRMSACKTLFKD